MIKIMNLRIVKPSKPYDVHVDRTSILGNPFVMINEKDRNSVCDKYIDHFDKESMNPKNILFEKELERLGNIYLKHGKLRLFCWCAPKRCHASTIRDYLLSLVA